MEKRRQQDVVSALAQQRRGAFVIGFRPGDEQTHFVTPR
jgi:hypothetical protein